MGSRQAPLNAAPGPAAPAAPVGSGQRVSGVLLHPTCLPGPHGIGAIGGAARAFAHRLAALGQRLWQMRPLGPTSIGDSPYQSFSSFAGNPQLICLEDLVGLGLLRRHELRGRGMRGRRLVDYGAVLAMRRDIFELLHRNFQQRASGPLIRAFRSFRREHRDWLEDYALFAALKQAHAGLEWQRWPRPYAAREPDALAAARRLFAAEIESTCLRQFLFYRQWAELRAHCAGLGIELIGDLPIFVALDSVDVWVQPELFQLDASGRPLAVAGVPPDYFSETGQLWGNPLYRWEVMERDDFAWWRRRLGAALNLVDRVRIDHFRGFESYWSIQSGSATAETGCWLPGPGDKLFAAFRRQFATPPIIAEDLGIITDAVNALRLRAGFPGMKVLQFCLENGAPEGADDPANFPLDSVCYTATHDNDTSLGWLRAKDRPARKRILTYLRSDSRRFHWDMIRACLQAPSRTAIVPLQDILGLDSRARFNRPGTAVGNWRWRFDNRQLDDRAIAHMRRLTETAGRAPATP